MSSTTSATGQPSASPSTISRALPTHPPAESVSAPTPAEATVSIAVGTVLSAKLTRCERSQPVVSTPVHLGNPCSEAHLENVTWKTTVESGTHGLWKEFRIMAVPSTRAAGMILSSTLRINAFTHGSYLLLPGIIYNGNRYPSLPKKYPPILDPDETHLSAHVSDIPRLDASGGDAEIQLLAGSLSDCVAAVFDPSQKRAVMLAFPVGGPAGEYGIRVSEFSSEQTLDLTVQSPGVRFVRRYEMCNTSAISRDGGCDTEPGEPLELKFWVRTVPCESVPALFDVLARSRGVFSTASLCPKDATLSQVWNILERKYNDENWNDAEGYYRIGHGGHRYHDLQVGWVGGLMNTLPLMVLGGDVSRSRAIQTVDFIVSNGQAASGFFKGTYHKGAWTGDGLDANDPVAEVRRGEYHLVRKSADALYFLLKHIHALESLDATQTGRIASWISAADRCSAAFASLWRNEGDLGQFVNHTTGQGLIKGSAAGALAPAALATAARMLDQPQLLLYAEEIGQFYLRHFTNTGVATGGPGDILQCPDSESAAALLESYVVLYEETGDRLWLQAAQDAAAQFASWQYAYDYPFPSTSEFGRLGIRSTGAVIANSQNQHGAPAICTLSGDALLKLYRATKDPLYATLLEQLVHNLPQYMSRADRPIHSPDGRPLPPGWINERVNTSDWDNNLGGVIYGSNWPEVSLMLTHLEVPGIYVDAPKGDVLVCDQVRASLESRAGQQFLLIENPTSDSVAVRVFIEEGETEPLRQDGWVKTITVPIAPHGEVRHPLE